MNQETSTLFAAHGLLFYDNFLKTWPSNPGSNSFCPFTRIHSPWYQTSTLFLHFLYLPLPSVVLPVSPLEVQFCNGTGNKTRLVLLNRFWSFTKMDEARWRSPTCNRFKLVSVNCNAVARKIWVSRHCAIRFCLFPWGPWSWVLLSAFIELNTTKHS